MSLIYKGRNMDKMIFCYETRLLTDLKLKNQTDHYSTGNFVWKNIDCSYLSVLIWNSYYGGMTLDI